MLRAFRDKWYERCTDGSFRQARYRLIDPDDTKYRCCLGVALAVGQELGLLAPEQAIKISTYEYLTAGQAKLLGIGYQVPFSRANDSAPVSVEGQYYPAEVLNLIKDHPVID